MESHMDRLKDMLGNSMYTEAKEDMERRDLISDIERYDRTRKYVNGVTTASVIVTVAMFIGVALLANK